MMHKHMARNLALVACALALAACTRSPQSPENEATTMNTDKAFLAEETAWRKQRLDNLVRPDGWTSLIGLHWVELKAHYIGSGETSGIRLAKGPPKLGLLQIDDGKLFFTPENDVALTLDDEPLTGRVELHDDSAQAPSVIGFDEGKGQLMVIERGGRHALRVKHADAESRTQFAGLDYWPADPAWRIEGRFVANPPGSTVPIVDIIGMTNEIPNPGAIEFEHDGKTHRIEALDEGGDELFLIFADRTSGHGSYGAGRYMYVDKPGADGKVVLDFNHAYNPPCAFTPFATCPLPSPENRLDLAITAGEKQYAGSVH